MGSLNTESTPVWRLKPHSGKGNGFIYVSITWVMFLLNGLNLMQGFKAIAWLSAWKNGKWDSQRYRKNANTAVDIYTILKWAIVLGIWYWKGNGGFCTFIVWYLLIANLHTFVYYFLFKPDPDPDFDRSRKRFIKLGMAFIFFDLCFAWLYSHPYYRDFHWPADPHHGWQAFWYSVANSMAADFGSVKPFTEWGEVLAVLQHVITFLFAGVLVTKAIPAGSSPS